MRWHFISFNKIYKKCVEITNIIEITCVSWKIVTHKPPSFISEFSKTFSAKGKVKYFDFAGHIVSLTTTQLCHYSMKAVIVNHVNKWVWLFPNKTLHIYKHWNLNFIWFSQVTKCSYFNTFQPFKIWKQFLDWISYKTSSGPDWIVVCQPLFYILKKTTF